MNRIGRCRDASRHRCFFCQGIPPGVVRKSATKRPEICPDLSIFVPDCPLMEALSSRERSILENKRTSLSLFRSYLTTSVPRVVKEAKNLECVTGNRVTVVDRRAY